MEPARSVLRARLNGKVLTSTTTKQSVTMRLAAVKGTSKTNSRGGQIKVKWKIRRDIRPGDIGRLVCLHGILYAREYGYDQTFEAYVAGGLAEFVHSFDPEKDRIWLAETSDQIIGSIAIVGHSQADAQLRWFLVHPDYRGLGVGQALIKKALWFSKERKYKAIFLWTTSDLTEADHLYMRFGFSKTEEKTHMIWGKRVTEERYDLSLQKDS